jgi:predicted histone-like DNA-binding protein
MTLKYRVVPKVDPRDLEAPPKYYPTAVSSGHMDLRALAGRIAEISTVSTIDSMAMLEALLVVIPKELSDGKIVELGEFGAFRLTLQASGEELPEAAGTHNIKGARVQFRPGKGFKEVLKALNFKAL